MQKRITRLFLGLLCAVLMLGMISCGKKSKALSNDELRDLASKSTVRVLALDSEGRTQGTGSGFFIDDEGTFITAYHVIDGAVNIKAETSSYGMLEVTTVVAFNPVYDLAILKANTSVPTAYMNIQKDQTVIKSLDDVYAAGSPLGTVGASLTPGVISYENRTYGMIECLQTTASISPGSSGGPLINKKGEVVGINAYSYINGDGMHLAIKTSMLDKIGEDVNYSMSQFASWYKKQISRSYHIYDTEEKKSVPSLINTYQQVISGAKCLASIDMDEVEHSGYSTDGDFAMYKYAYIPNQYDRYQAYLEEQGFEYDAERSSDAAEGDYYFVNEFTGVIINMWTDDAEQYLYISIYR